MTDMDCRNLRGLTLQFHITGRCNLRCKHCYRTEGDVEPLSFSDIVRVIDQFLILLDRYNRASGSTRRGHINITGGEPFLRSDIRDILRLLGSHRDRFSYAVLSNGSFLDDGLIALLKETGITFLQLSLDGDREIHDSLRCPGDYDRVLDTAEYLEKQGIPTQISFTANRKNMHCLPLAAKQCRSRGITKLWSDRLVPIGTGEELEELTITEKELPGYLRYLNKARGGFLTRALHPKTRVTRNRALQFLDGGERIYACSAGDRLITVDEFGQILPCRRMPAVCGDVFHSTLEQVYYHHPLFRELRLRAIPKECGTCQYRLLCRGGAKCQSAALTGSPHHADPACPLRNSRPHI